MSNPPYEGEHFIASGGVEAVRWFIEEEQPGVVDERLGKFDALLHAGGIAAHLAVALFEKADVAEGFGGAFAGH